MSNKTKVVTGINTRFSYFNGWEPVSINGSKPKYSISVLIPKTDTVTINKINEAIDIAIEEGIARFGGKKPNKATLKLNTKIKIALSNDADACGDTAYDRYSRCFLRCRKYVF